MMLTILAGENGEKVAIAKDEEVVKDSVTAATQEGLGSNK